jgi:hypothetical protein
MNEDNLNTLVELQNKYKSQIININNSIKKKFFVPLYNQSKEKIQIKSYDDMYLEMYFKSKYLDNNIINDINKKCIKTGNIVNDINFLMTKFDIKFLHDDKFKVSKFNTKKINNYFNPKNENEIIMYNSIDKNTYQQSEFRKQLWKIEKSIKNEYSQLYNKNINISFYDDEKYDMIWIIITINDIIDNHIIDNDNVFGFND